MKILLTIILIMWITGGIYSQPLNGNFTIGGQSPDFETLQDASNALKMNGVSGPVFFNIRPGTYMKNGGNNSVLLLDSIVSGLSPSNRITFQPDESSGGNAENVILEMNITDPSTASRELVIINLDYITLRNLTLQEADASQRIAFSKLILVQGAALDLNVDGVIIEGCILRGTSPFGTENGIELGGQAPGNIMIRGNTFLRFLRGVSAMNTTGIVQGTFIIENNNFLAGWRSSSGSGNPLGAAMEVHGQTLIVQRNIIDFEGSHNGGYQGIFVYVPTGTEKTIIQQNSVKGSVINGLIVQGFIGIPDSFIIANNMINITGSTGLKVFQTGNAKILFNTILIKGGGLTGLSVLGDDCIVLNNIIIAKTISGFNVGYDQGNLQSANLNSDYNVIFMELGVGSSGPLVIRNAVQYPTLALYQAGTGLDTNSISKDIDFIDSTNIHLSDCQAQDPELKGIPVDGITVDIDGEIRSETFPMIGADENGIRVNDMFADPFRAGLPGTSFSVAAGDFDKDGDEDIAVPDYDNLQILFFSNQHPDRSFVHSGTFSLSTQPTAVLFYDLDLDNNLDLIAGSDTNAVTVFWGDGMGGTISSETVTTFGRVRSIEPGPVFSGNIQRTIAITEDNGFLPNTSTLGYLMHLGDRNLCHDVQYAPGNIPPDTVNAVMTDFIIGDLLGDGDIPEIAAVTSFPLPHPLIVISDIIFIGSVGPPCAGVVPLGDITEYQFGTGVGSTAGHSNIIKGDFDGDSDLDLITLETFSSVLFIRNQGSLNFSSESISVSGAQGLVSMDYENDGDLDFVTVNELLETKGVSVFLNDGSGNFTTRENCFFPYATGRPFGAAASDFDLDGKTDIAFVSSSGTDSLFVLYNLGGGTVGIYDQKIEDIPAEFSLSQNYPNPFNPSTSIEYTLSSESIVKISIYNILGEKVREIVNTQIPAGTHKINFNASDLTSGIYIYRIEAKDSYGKPYFLDAKKMMLLK